MKLTQGTGKQKMEVTAHSQLLSLLLCSFWLSSFIPSHFPRAPPRTSLQDSPYASCPAAQWMLCSLQLPLHVLTASCQGQGLLHHASGKFCRHPSGLGYHLRFLRQHIALYYILGPCPSLPWKNPSGIPKAPRTGSKQPRLGPRTP